MNTQEPCEVCGERRRMHAGPYESIQGKCRGFCPGDSCPYCNGTDCVRHGQEPCECDSIDRHELDEPDDECEEEPTPRWWCSPRYVLAVVGIVIALLLALLAGAIYATDTDERVELYLQPVTLPAIRAPLLTVEKRVRYDDLCIINETVLVYYGGNRQWAGRSFVPLSHTPRDLWPCSTTAYGEVENPGQYSNYHDNTVRIGGGAVIGGVVWTDAEEHPLHYVGYLSGNVYTEDLHVSLGLSNEEIIR